MRVHSTVPRALRGRGRDLQLAGLAVFPGCTNVTSPERPITFHLDTVNGASLPVEISASSSSRIEILGGDLVLKNHSEYASTTTLRRTNVGVDGEITTVSIRAVGHYHRSGDEIVLRDTSGANATFLVRNSQRRLEGPGVPTPGPALGILRSFVYVR